MNKYDLSILIPARHEEWLKTTVEGLLKNIRGNTEIIVHLDGEWANPSLPDDPRLTIIYSPTIQGQRAGTNRAAKISRAKYVMKLDAHCIVDEGFDVKLMEAIKGHDDWTIVPAMYNLHAFTWRCKKCGNEWYQGPTPETCKDDQATAKKRCDAVGKDNFERKIVWKHRENRRSETYRTDLTLHFQYWGAFKDREENIGKDLVESFSIQGSCFMLTRQKYWDLNICDESWGSWGQQGVEVAFKTWLSGGKVMIYRKTWYAHLFRTQGGDFGFPYQQNWKKVDETRALTRDIFFHNKWPLQIHPFSWLLERFFPIPEWHEPAGDELMKMINEEGKKWYKTHPVSDLLDTEIKTYPARFIETGGKRADILFFTDNQLSLRYAKPVQKQLQSIGLDIISVSLKPMAHFGRNIYLPLERGWETYFKQILVGLEVSDAEIIYMCEHDVLYHPSHFQFMPEEKDKFYYNQNFWRIRPEVDDFAVHWDANQVSGLVAYRETLLKFYRERLDQIQKEGFNRSYEPGGRNSELSVPFKSEFPNIDIRHKGTLTKDKWSLKDFRDKSTSKGWTEGKASEIEGWTGETFKNILLPLFDDQEPFMH